MMSFEQEDKGALLYQESGSRRLQILGGLVFAAIFLTVAVSTVLAILGPWGKFALVEPPLRFIGFVIPIMFVVLSVGFVMLSFRGMPFRVYERGVTMRTVSFRDGLAGREAFVPAGEIARVTYETTYYFKVGDVEHFRFHRLDGETFDIAPDDGDEERVTGLLRRVLRCDVEGLEKE